MFVAMPFTEWFAIVKMEFSRAGLSLPEDMELMELAHMECLEDEKSVEDFVKEAISEQKTGGQAQ